VEAAHRMKTVSRFEANLVRLLRCLLQKAPRDQISKLLANPTPRPPCLCRDAIDLVQDTLAKGCISFLARRGWRRERFLRDGQASEGRLWQRTPPVELGLTFAPHSLEFLVQLSSGSLGSFVPNIIDLTIGDRLLFVLAFDALADTNAADDMAKHWTTLHQDGLARLAFAEELAHGDERIDWSVWTTGVGSCILETLQTWLAERWCTLERKKGNITTVARMRKIAQGQRVYHSFLDALEITERRDLARGILEAASRLLRDRPDAQRWIGKLDVSKERLANRQKTYREALTFVELLHRFQQWNQHAQSVGYFDAGYHASQLWKADWERFGGDELHERAITLLREVEPL
jgi:hypothetical protein